MCADVRRYDVMSQIVGDHTQLFARLEFAVTRPPVDRPHFAPEVIGCFAGSQDAVLIRFGDLLDRCRFSFVCIWKSGLLVAPLVR